MLSVMPCEQPDSRVGMAKHCLAKAKFDNLADSPDELAFKKDDILAVIDQRIDGLDGWWLCSIRGRQGIAPANRLDLLAGMYNDSVLGFSATPDSSISDVGEVDYDIPRKINQSTRKLPPTPDQLNQPATRDLLYDIPKSLERMHLRTQLGSDATYDTPQRGQGFEGRALMSPPGYKSADSAVDMRSNRSSMLSNTSSPTGSSVYDSSRSSMELLDAYDVPQSKKKSVSKPEGLYDVPRNTRAPPHTDTSQVDVSRDSGIYDNAKLGPSAGSEQTAKLPALQQKNAGVIPLRKGERSLVNGLKGSLQADGVYDVPPQVLRDNGSDTPHNSPSLTKRETSEIIDVSQYEELPLELEAAVEILVKLQQHVHTSTSRFLSFVHHGWRNRNNLESVLYDLKISTIALQNTLREFIDFCTGALANSSRLTDRSIAMRLSQLLHPLQDKMQVIDKSVKTLSAMKWHLARLEDKGDGATDKDELAQVVLVSRHIGDDVSRVASVIHGNSTLLFKRSATDSVAPSKRETMVRQESTESYHEYDYCDLKDPVSIPETVTPHRAPDAEILEDSKYLSYYSHHTHTILDQIKGNMDKLHDSLERQESIHSFVAQSKLLVASAHKLVYIGDTLSRNIRQSSVRTIVTDSANSLCDSLKDVILCTKDAALSPPEMRSRSIQKLRVSAEHVHKTSSTFQDVILAQSKQ